MLALGIIVFCLASNAALAVWMAPPETTDPETYHMQFIASAGFPIRTASELSVAEQLRAAQDLQNLGDYEKAVQAYRSVINSAAVNSPEQIEASFRLGETYFLAENYAEAIKALASFIRSYPTDERQGQAVFWCGQSYFALGNWSEAIAQYQKYLTIDETVASFIYEVMGDAYLAAHDYAATEEAYRRGLSGPIDGPMKIHLLEGIADAQLKAARYLPAVATYDAILESSDRANYRARIEYQAGQALAVAGKTQDSYARYRAAVDSYPTTYHAYLSLIELVNAGQTVDQFQRGLIDYHSEAYTPAVRAFEQYIKNAPAGYAGEAHYYSGLAYEALGNYAQAITRFNEVIERFPKGAYLGRAWLGKGQVFADQSKWDRAAEEWARFVKLYPADASAPDALWLTGHMWEQQGKFKEAAASYAQTQADYPNSARAAAASYQSGLCSFRAADYDKAINAWQTLSETYPSAAQRPAALYWLGRAFHARGADDKARTYLDKIQQEYPGQYYALRAEELEQTWQSKLFKRPAQKNMLLAPPSPEEQAEAEKWLLSWSATQSGEGESVSQLPDGLAKDGRLLRGLRLWQLGLTSDAAAQVGGLKADLNDSPLGLYRLGVYLQQKGLYRLSVSCIERLIALTPNDKRATVPAFLLKLTHPFHYSNLLVAEAASQNVDPLLLLALVRQESSFEWHAESWAGAQGLMQVMPTTADWIALQLAWKGYKRNLADRPYVNVRFGTWYLARQLSTFQGDIVAALTAYNAGPGRVTDWQTTEMAGDDDLFLEYMPLAEPRLYAEKIFAHYYIYRKLYAS